MAMTRITNEAVVEKVVKGEPGDARKGRQPIAVTPTVPRTPGNTPAEPSPAGSAPAATQDKK
jgi:hypothetical protein